MNKLDCFAVPWFWSHGLMPSPSPSPLATPQPILCSTVLVMIATIVCAVLQVTCMIMPNPIFNLLMMIFVGVDVCLLVVWVWLIAVESYRLQMPAVHAIDLEEGLL